MLSREGRLDDYMAGFRFENATAPPDVRVPLLASRSVVVPDAALARSLQEEYPEAQVRFAPLGVRGVQGVQGVQGVRDRVSFGLLDHSRRDVVERAFQRARDAGAAIDLLKADSAARILAECDAVIALIWPPFEMPLTAALAGMAAGKPVVAMEIEATADWPALDPQTWRPRGLGATAAPIAVTIEPRDEEHSLMLAMRRLATDAPLREQLGHAAYTWWQAHATPAHAAAAWQQILEEALSLSPPSRPPDWPKHLGADGTELARSILNEFGLRSGI
jgi:glycosyltransferase involved in cell wall biosynthesis